MTGPTERTRALVTRELGVALELVAERGYREQGEGALAGEWLGAFAQPGLVLNKATAMRVELDGEDGTSVDEYGTARLAITRHEGERIAWRKDYGGPTKTFDYVGRIAHGVIAGYWYAPAVPRFGGVFWLARADQLTEASATALRGKVRTWSWRRHALRALLVGMVAVPVLAPPLVAVPAVGSAWLALYALNRRREAMAVERREWERLLR